MSATGAGGKFFGPDRANFVQLRGVSPDINELLPPHISTRQRELHARENISVGRDVTAGVTGAARIASFFLAQSMLGTAIPHAFEALTSDEEVQHLGSQILSEVVESADCNTEAIGYFRRMARLRERSSDKIRFFTRLAFTPSVSEWSVVQLPAPLFPLYRVIRLFRLLRKLI